METLAPRLGDFHLGESSGAGSHVAQNATTDAEPIIGELAKC